MARHAFSQMQRVHMIGIGGIGMSALAQLLQHEGKEVSGSDRSESPSLKLLREKGIAITVGHDAHQVREDTDIVIFSGAIASDNSELLRARRLGIPTHSYFQALGEISKGKKTIAIAGTHGKTTTTGMLAKILIDAGKAPSVIAGSILKDFGSNFVAGESNLFLVEACEYKRHFLHLAPTYLVVTNIEWEHTDYYHDLADVQAAFRELMARVPVRGAVIANTQDDAVVPLLEDLQSHVVDFADETVPELQLIGEFNRQNARAAKAAARVIVPKRLQHELDASLQEFQGTWRRFEKKGETPAGALVYDDYAHHPTAIRKTLAAAREAFPEKNVTVVFHPHLFSRTRDLFDDFAESLSTADRVLVAPIYAAREEPDPEISHLQLAKEINALGTSAEAIDTFEAIATTLHNTCGQGDLIITMGAGDIYQVAERITRG